VFLHWTARQTINIQGYANETAADRAWRTRWRRGCEATIIYQGR